MKAAIIRWLIVVAGWQLGAVILKCPTRSSLSAHCCFPVFAHSLHHSLARRPPANPPTHPPTQSVSYWGKAARAHQRPQSTIPKAQTEAQKSIRSKRCAPPPPATATTRQPQSLPASTLSNPPQDAISQILHPKRPGKFLPELLNYLLPKSRAPDLSPGTRRRR